MNPYQGWLYLIGTPQRARKLWSILPKLGEARKVNELILDHDGMPALYLMQREPAMCPTVALFGVKEAAKLYADARLRPALDAYDTGEITKADLRRCCTEIINGRYAGKHY